MNKKLILKLIIVSLVISIILIVALLIILFKNNENSNELGNQIQQEQPGENFLETYGKNLDGSIDKQAYFDSINCIRQYLNSINTKNDAYYTYDEQGNYVLSVDEEIIKRKTYNLLSEKYIAKNNITVENVYDKIETLDKFVLFVPLEISIVQDDEIKSFLVHGLLETQDNYKVVDERFILVNIDMAESIFSIEPIEGNYSTIKEIKITEFENTIQNKENNEFDSPYVTNEDIIKDYINLYKRLALGKPEKMYELLNNEYKTAKFGNIENFKKYVQENRQKIIGISPKKYQAIQLGGNNVQYICIDQNDSYYIFNETGTLQYTAILDTYTIDQPEFIEKYQKESDEKKVLMNIQKFFTAIEDGDYNYAYSKLDATYKANNYKTLAEFENYAKQNFFSKNNLSSGSAKKQENVYLYDITISDKTGTNKNVITKTFVMQLKEGTDFVMSFSK